MKILNNYQILIKNKYFKEKKIFKIRTNEELMICQDTYNLLKNI
ncbi:hypothetical protein [Spiroplasma endosymbiont of Acasis viretata]